MFQINNYNFGGILFLLDEYMNTLVSLLGSVIKRDIIGGILHRPPGQPDYWKDQLCFTTEYTAIKVAPGALCTLWWQNLANCQNCFFFTEANGHKKL